MRRQNLLLTTIIALLISLHTWADTVLFDFDHGELGRIPLRSVQARIVVVDGKNRALRIDSTTAEDWPGLTLACAEGTWDVSAFEAIEMDVKNVGVTGMELCLRIDNAGADGVKNCITGRISLQPGETGTLREPLARVNARQAPIKFIGMRGNPFQGERSQRMIDPANVTQLLIFFPKPTENHCVEVDAIRAVGTYVAPAVAQEWTKETFLPFIDAFGQYIHRDWPGKTRDVADLRSRVAQETAELLAEPGPDGWDSYGGWRDGPALAARGFFYPAKHDGKWWLVDPEGRLFFSHGIDCIRCTDLTPVDEREGWFQNFPGDRAEFNAFFGTQGHVVRGHYKGKQPRGFHFGPANLKRKYATADWFEAFAERTHRRLRSWGVNTIANWSDSKIYLMRKTPYVVSINFSSKQLAGSSGYWSKFRDVFDPDFKTKLRARMDQEQGRSAEDPWCIGYFVDNEISWGSTTSLAEGTLASPETQVAKQVFIADLKQRYGEIAVLNAAWGTSHASWEALLAHRQAPDLKRARTDLETFYRKTARTYFTSVRDVVKSVAPNQLYLGCRFAWVNAVVAEEAASVCDVVSYNLYRRDVSQFRLPGGTDVPLIIGEFHFGALDRGLFHTGLVPVSSQEARAEAYESYVRGVLNHPSFVGCHWFKYMDEPTTGRALDGENYQIGFIDICDTPYPETIAASRRVGSDLYRVRSGKEEPE